MLSNCKVIKLYTLYYIIILCILGIIKLHNKYIMHIQLNNF